MDKGVLWRAGMALVAAGAILAPGCKKAPPPPPPVVEEAPAEETVDPNAPLITQEEYDQLLYDMPFLDVLKVIGEDYSDTEDEYRAAKGPYGEAHVISWYTWKNPDGTSARVGFEDKKLYEKSTEGLPSAEQKETQ